MRGFILVIAVVLCAGVASGEHLGVDAGPVHVTAEGSGPHWVNVEISGLETMDPGDDEITVFQDVKSVTVAVDAPVAPLSLSLDLTEPVIEHPLFVIAGSVMDEYRALAPDDVTSRVDLSFDEQGIHPYWYLHPDASTEALLPMLASHSSQLSYPNEWDDMPLYKASVGYDVVFVPTGLANSTDQLLSTSQGWLELCWFSLYWAAVFGTEHCVTQDMPVPWDGLKAALPNVGASFHLERLELQLGHAGSSVSDVGGAVPRLEDGTLSAERSTEVSTTQVGTPRTSSLSDIDEIVQSRSAHDGTAAQRTPGEQASGVAPDAAVALIVAALALAVAYLYHRLQREDLVRHPHRAAILEAAAKQPGIMQHEVARQLGLRHSLVDYHTRLLANEGLLEVRTIAGWKCFFLPSGAALGEGRVRTLLRRGRARNVLLAIARQPDITLSEVAEQGAMTVSSVHWHVQRFQSEGIVSTTREGRQVKLRINPDRNRMVLDALTDV
jgi:predicted transcriptional regulator